MGREIDSIRESLERSASPPLDAIRGGLAVDKPKGPVMKKIKLTGPVDAGWLRGDAGDEFMVSDERAANLLKAHPDFVKVEDDPRARPVAADAAPRVEKTDDEDVPGAPPVPGAKDRRQGKAVKK